MDTFIEFMKAIQPFLYLIGFVGLGFLGWRITKISVGKGGINADLVNGKAEKKGRARVQLAERIRDKQRIIDKVLLQYRMFKSMRLAEENLSIIQNRFVENYQKLLAPRVTEEEMRYANDEGEVFIYQTLWGKLIYHYKEILKESFEVNGFCHMDEVAFSDFIKQKLNVLWIESLNFWNRHWPPQTNVDRYESLKSIEGMQEEFYKILYRLYKGVAEIALEAEEKVAGLEEEIEELIQELREER